MKIDEAQQAKLKETESRIKQLIGSSSSENEKEKEGQETTEEKCRAFDQLIGEVKAQAMD